jgi:hypothetical protein
MKMVGVIRVHVHRQSRADEGMHDPPEVGPRARHSQSHWWHCWQYRDESYPGHVCGSGDAYSN